MPRTPDMKRRAEIAARAFEVLRERGLQRTGMADVATALGMKRPTLYWYFRDLGQLFDELPVFRTAQPTAAGDDDFGVLEPWPTRGLFADFFEHLHRW